MLFEETGGLQDSQWRDVHIFGLLREKPFSSFLKKS
jgi:hypothetical protein